MLACCMWALMVMLLPVQGANTLLAHNNTSTDDWNARCHMDAPANWLPSRGGTGNEADVAADDEDNKVDAMI